jgi:adenine-specific DNA-methyltransferase
VVDGLVNADVARLLVDALPHGELLTLCGTAVDPEARPTLRDLRPGSVVRKIPASILAEYRRPRWESAIEVALVYPRIDGAVTGSLS